MRILIVEDNYLVGQSLKQMLVRLGHVPLGPLATAEEAIAFLEDHAIDMALLDIEIRDGTSGPIAKRLVDLDRPFMYVSAFGSAVKDMRPTSSQPLLHKPISPQSLATALEAIALTRSASSMRR